MAGGPFFPISVYNYDVNGNIFPNYYSGGGGNAASHDEGIAVVGTLTADTTVEMRFHVPPAVPSGTMKLRVLALSGATTGVAKFTVKDANVAAGSSPSAATLTTETQQTVTWTAADIYNEAKVTLTPTPSANDIMVVAVTFNTTGWTLASVSTWIFSLIWE